MMAAGAVTPPPPRPSAGVKAADSLRLRQRRIPLSVGRPDAVASSVNVLPPRPTPVWPDVRFSVRLCLRVCDSGDVRRRVLAL